MLNYLRLVAALFLGLTGAAFISLFSMWVAKVVWFPVGIVVFVLLVAGAIVLVEKLIGGLK